MVAINICSANKKIFAAMAAAVSAADTALAAAVADTEFAAVNEKVFAAVDAAVSAADTEFAAANELIQNSPPPTKKYLLP